MRLLVKRIFLMILLSSTLNSSFLPMSNNGNCSAMNHHRPIIIVNENPFFDLQQASLKTAILITSPLEDIKISIQKLEQLKKELEVNIRAVDCLESNDDLTPLYNIISLHKKWSLIRFFGLEGLKIKLLIHKKFENLNSEEYSKTLNEFDLTVDKLYDELLPESLEKIDQKASLEVLTAVIKWLKVARVDLDLCKITFPGTFTVMQVIATMNPREAVCAICNKKDYYLRLILEDDVLVHRRCKQMLIKHLGQKA